MRRLTKVEMYNIITNKYPSLRALDLEGGYNHSGVRRDELWAIMIELKLPLNKEQKKKVAYEKNFNMIKECEKNGE